MTRAYIYMQLSGTTELVTLGRLVVQDGVGEFVFSPDHVERKRWVPDPFHYPLRSEPYPGIVSNNGLNHPGFRGACHPFCGCWSAASLSQSI